MDYGFLDAGKPLNNSVIFLIYRFVRDQDIIFKACMGLSKIHTTEHGQTCKPPSGESS